MVYMNFKRFLKKHLPYIQCKNNNYFHKFDGFNWIFPFFLNICIFWIVCSFNENIWMEDLYLYNSEFVFQLLFPCLSNEAVNKLLNLPAAAYHVLGMSMSIHHTFFWCRIAQILTFFSISKYIYFVFIPIKMGLNAECIYFDCINFVYSKETGIKSIYKFIELSICSIQIIMFT